MAEGKFDLIGRDVTDPDLNFGDCKTSVMVWLWLWCMYGLVKKRGHFMNL